ncbi:MAG: ABC transporter permease [Eubacteriales bacterium]|nr:ABC transporter permease [Eubacteriales bacterium]
MNEKTAEATFRFDFKGLFKKFFTEYLIIVGILVLGIFTAVSEPVFLSYDNFVSFVRQFCPLAFVALGMTLIIIGGYIDLSVAGMFSFMGLVSCMLMNHLGGMAIIPIIIIGAICGLVNALVLIVCGARDDSDALFITFGMQMVFAALALLINGGNCVFLEDKSGFNGAIGNGSLLGIPTMLFLFLAMAFVLHFFMTKTPLGRSIHIAGANPVAARLCGVSINKIILLAFVITGALTAIGSWMMACRTGSALPVCGKNYETYAILSVTVGGTSLAGGKGSVLRTIVGVAVYTLMANSMNILGVSSNMQFVFKGIIMITAIWIDSRRPD